MKKAILHPASMWDCENCGQENFVRSISVVLNKNDEADAETIKALYGDDEGDFEVMAMTCPGTVTCSRCGETFGTDHDRIGEEMDSPL